MTSPSAAGRRRSRHAKARVDERRVIVFGAGDAGRRLLRNMMRDEHSGFYPVALLDDVKGAVRTPPRRISSHAAS